MVAHLLLELGHAALELGLPELLPNLRQHLEQRGRLVVVARAELRERRLDGVGRVFVGLEVGRVHRLGHGGHPGLCHGVVFEIDPLQLAAVLLVGADAGGESARADVGDLVVCGRGAVVSRGGDGATDTDAQERNNTVSVVLVSSIFEHATAPSSVI